MTTEELILDMDKLYEMFVIILSNEYKQNDRGILYLLYSMDNIFRVVQRGLKENNYRDNSRLRISAIRAMVQYEKLFRIIKLKTW